MKLGRKVRLPWETSFDPISRTNSCENVFSKKKLKNFMWDWQLRYKQITIQVKHIFGKSGYGLSLSQRSSPLSTYTYRRHWDDQYQVVRSISAYSFACTSHPRHTLVTYILAKVGVKEKQFGFRTKMDGAKIGLSLDLTRAQTLETKILETNYL